MRRSILQPLAEFWVARSSLRFRTEIPTDVSWSPDGSLLAVCVGCHVAIYEPETNALCQVLTCPDCPSVTSVQFVGSSGRYLVVNGSRDVFLWDLIFQSRMSNGCARSPVPDFFPL